MGIQIRNWLWVEDFASAIDIVLERGEPGEVYNVGGPDELPNIEVVRRILELTGSRRVADRARRRPARHDRRYSLSSDEDRGGSAGRPQCNSTRDSSARSRGIARTSEWWKPIRSGEYRAYYERQYGTKLA